MAMKGEEVAMRTRMAFLSCAVVTAVGLLTATSASSGGIHASTPVPAPPLPPTSCSTGEFQVTVTKMPTIVSSDTCPSGYCTEIEYTVSPPTRQYTVVTVLEGIGIQYMSPYGEVSPPCQGDGLIGFRSCHEQAAEFTPKDDVWTFTIGLDGRRNPSPTTVATRKGLLQFGQCRILGIGLEGGASGDEPVATKKTETFGDCKLDETIKPDGSADVSASGDGCYLLDPDGTDLKKVELTVPCPSGAPVCGGNDTHTVKGVQAQAFSFTSSGSKCFSTVIPTPNGRLYTVCK
jgi:hypothetical protein